MLFLNENVKKKIGGIKKNRKTNTTFAYQPNLKVNETFPETRHFFIYLLFLLLLLVAVVLNNSNYHMTSLLFGG